MATVTVRRPGSFRLALLPLTVLAILFAEVALPPGDRVRGDGARRVRASGWTADNGDPAGTPIPTASMVKLFMAEDILHRSRVGLLDLTREDFAQLQVMIRHS